MRPAPSLHLARARRLVAPLAALGVIGGALVGPAVLTAAAAGSTGQTLDQPFSDTSAQDGFEAIGGTWQVIGGSYHQSGGPDVAGTNASLSVLRAPTSGDTWRATSVVEPAATAPADVSLVFDFSDRDDYSYVHLDQVAARSGILTVRRGVQTRVSALPTTVVPGRSYDVELRRDPAGIRVFAGVTGARRVFVGRAPLLRATGHRVGYGSWAGSAAFDDLVVRGVSAPVSTPAPTPTTPTPSSGSRIVPVSTSPQLTAALADARPGDVITLADGVYTSTGVTASTSVGGKRYAGTFVAQRAGTAQQPITLRGSRAAVIDGAPGGDGTRGRYGLYLVGADHWHVSGITVTNAAKGIVVDRSDHAVIDGVAVSRTGQEGIHLRAGSSDDVVRGSRVATTGLSDAAFGEGVYVGSAHSNWATYSNGEPDASDRNQILDNVIGTTGAESIDVKEGTTGGLVSGNSFDGSGMTGSFADSWIDLKGNGWSIVGNHGVHAPLDGFQVHTAVTGWGRGNTFSGNVADVGAAGFGVRLQDTAAGNVVSCDNTVTHAASGLTNGRCS